MWNLKNENKNKPIDTNNTLVFAKAGVGRWGKLVKMVKRVKNNADNKKIMLNIKQCDNRENRL